MRRHLVLPDAGVVLVSTDVHGNDADMARLEAAFLVEREVEPESHWVILGDIVHAPSETARAEHPELYGFPDGSMNIVDRILRLHDEHPGRVHFVLGNHDHGHVGGPHTQKFYGDEVAALERTLTSAERERLHGLFHHALLAVAAPCGVLLTHGAPDDTLDDLRALDDVPLDVREMTSAQRSMTRALLTSYGQPDAVVRTMLGNVSRSLGFDLGIVIHGHDRDEHGFFKEGKHQLCPCLFGATNAEKRYVRLDLGARYADVEDLRDGEEIRRLYPPGPTVSAPRRSST